MVETVQDRDEHREVTLAYHQGKTNHRGLNETYQALRRKYFWWNMRKTIQEIIDDRHPPKATQEETPTAKTPLVELQIDTFTWRGYKWVTVIYLFSKMDMAHQMREISAEAVLGALRLWFQFYGVPEWITSNAGREFDNANVREEMKALEVRWHLNTPRHPKSRGSIERLHGTLSNHLLD
nr:uncharacterized protein LOC106691700 [Halyomorpha halys]